LSCVESCEKNEIKGKGPPEEKAERVDRVKPVEKKKRIKKKKGVTGNEWFKGGGPSPTIDECLKLRGQRHYRAKKEKIQT